MARQFQSIGRNAVVAKFDFGSAPFEQEWLDELVQNIQLLSTVIGVSANIGVDTHVTLIISGVDEEILYNMVSRWDTDYDITITRFN